jgi:hypothetical protein
MKKAQYISDGLYYKQGVHNLVFVWLFDEWMKSEKSWTEVKKGKLLTFR